MEGISDLANLDLFAIDSNTTIDMFLQSNNRLCKL